MQEPRMRPRRDALESPASTHIAIADDIELPPVHSSFPQAQTARSQTGGDAAGITVRQRRKRRGAMWALGLAVLASLSGALFHSSTATESGHPNWEHVAAATAASEAQGSDLLVHIDRLGRLRIAPAVEVTSGDIDEKTSRAVRSSQQSTALGATAPHLRGARQYPAAGGMQTSVPQVTAHTSHRSAAETERTKYFEMQVFDCCDEDGDVVQIVVNGQPFMTVPITHEGTTISVPLLPGSNTLSLRGVRDGRGGITVSFRTSRGEYFSRRMKVGEEHLLGVIVR